MQLAQMVDTETLWRSQQVIALEQVQTSLLRIQLQAVVQE